MRFGICCPVEEASNMIAAGFDYAEVAAHDLPDHLELLGGLPIEATNLFFPGNFRLFGDSVGNPIAHARKVIQAATALGVKVMVIGSGNQRRTGNLGIDEAFQRFVELAGEIQHIADEFQISIAPESLHGGETNVGNDLHTLAVALKEKNVGYTADCYHVFQERSYMAAIDWTHEITFAPRHVHLADKRRYLPKRNDSEVLNFLGRLKKLEYDERISFEGDLQSTSAAEAQEAIRKFWSRA